MSLFSWSQVKKTKPGNYRNLIIGTYTKSGKSKGIYVFRFNTLTGSFKKIAEADGVENPSYLCLSRDHHFVYAVNENEPGRISSFSYKSATGELKFVNQVNSGGDDPCYITTDRENHFAFVANYTGGSLSAIPLLANGSLGSDIQIIQHTGKGIDTARQEKAHVHTTVLSPDQKFLLATDLGTDSLSIYTVNHQVPSNPLGYSFSHGIKVEAGNGPRHLSFSPNGKRLYLLQELRAKINVYDYKAGTFALKQSIPLESPRFLGKLGAADIHISPDAKFLYASNRGEANDLVIFSILKDGTLKLKARQSVLGKTPRNFALDPTGNFILVANQNSDEIVVFKRNRVSGLLTPLSHRINIGSPVCLQFD